MKHAIPVIFIFLLIAVAVSPPGAVTQELEGKAQSNTTVKTIPAPPGPPVNLTLAQGEDNDPSVEVQPGRKVKVNWDPPKKSGPIHHYFVERVQIGPTFPDTTTFDNVLDNFLVIYVEHGKPSSLRVAAVDTFNQLGAFSEPIPVYGARVRKGF